MKGSRALFSQATHHWSTPDALYCALDAEFGFTFDPCPIKGGLGLLRSWEGERVYCNPPYGPKVGEWLEKAFEPEIAVYLLPARTDTRWFHRYAFRATEIRFLKGRLHFAEHTMNAPFPSLLLIYNNASQSEKEKPHDSR